MNPRCASEPGVDESPAATGRRRCMHLEAGVTAVREGRRFVQAEALARGATAFADDAALVASELLANATQHGDPPLTVCVTGDGLRLRLEVSDASSRLPVRLGQSATNMTGRGLALVHAVSSTWGTQRTTGGKTVWAEFTTGAPQSVTVDPDTLRVQWSDEPAAEERFTVDLGEVPTE